MAKIWHPNNKVSLEVFNTYNNNSLHASLDIIFTEIGDDFVKGTMHVNNKTIQPYGLLHGGASVALAESLGSTGAGLRVDHRKYKVVGQEINANHVRSATEGIVTGIAKPIYLKGMMLDYKGGLDGKGFVFVNPNATSTCGCGESFSIT